jgi:hypothetical protein
MSQAAAKFGVKAYGYQFTDPQATPSLGGTFNDMLLHTPLVARWCLSSHLLQSPMALKLPMSLAKFPRLPVRRLGISALP